MSWYYVREGKSKGPVDDGVLLQWEQDGTLGPESLVWTEGMADWATLKDARKRLKGARKVPPPPDRPLSRPRAEPEAVAAAVEPASGRRPGEDGPDGSTDFRYAGFWARAGARVLDSILLQVAWSTPLSFFIKHVLLPPGASPLALLHESLKLIPLSMLVPALYEIILTARLGGTLGKLALGLQVVDLGGRRLDLERSTYRFLAYLLSCLTLFIGILVMLGHERRQTMHDRLVGTLVVKA